MYAGRVACWFLVSDDEYSYGTDRRTRDRYITLSAIDAVSEIIMQLMPYPGNSVF